MSGMIRSVNGPGSAGSRGVSTPPNGSFSCDRHSQPGPLPRTAERQNPHGQPAPPATWWLGVTKRLVPGARAFGPHGQPRAFGPLRARCPRSRKDGRTYFRGNPEVTYEWSDAYASFTRRPLDPTATRHRHLGVRAGHTVSGYVGILRAGCPRSRKDGRTYLRGNPGRRKSRMNGRTHTPRSPVAHSTRLRLVIGTSACARDTPSPGTWASCGPDARAPGKTANVLSRESGSHV